MNTFSLIKDPFTDLDAYNEEAFVWAQEIASKIDIDKFKEKDPLIISVSFAYIFSMFIYLTMHYFLNEFDYYLDEHTKKTKPDSWKKMHNCIDEIHKAMMKVYKDNYEIYLTLYNSILIEVPDEDSDNESDTIKIVPYNFDGFAECSGFSFVEQGFNW